MNQILRFWLLLVSFSIATAAFGYLSLSFASFISPEVAILSPDSDNQLVAAAVALISMAAFLWAYIGSTSDTTTE